MVAIPPIKKSQPRTAKLAQAAARPQRKERQGGDPLGWGWAHYRLSGG